MARKTEVYTWRVSPVLKAGLEEAARSEMRTVGQFNAYGYVGLAVPPGLWGGFADYLYLDPNAIVHNIDPAISPEIATLFNPLGAGFRWAVEMPRLAPGDTIVILGPGQRGLACVIAAREAGAGLIMVTGLAVDEHKLALARAFGAHHTVNVEAQDPGEALRDISGGRGADVVIDVTAYSVDAVNQAVALARLGGTIVLAGTKGPKPVPDFLVDRLIMKELTLMGALGVRHLALGAARGALPGLVRAGIGGLTRGAPL